MSLLFSHLSLEYQEIFLSHWYSSMLLLFFVNLQDTLYSGSISRDQVAEVAVGALLCTEASYKVVEIVARADAPNRPLEDMFAAIKQN
jgi:hypothetical protein